MALPAQFSLLESEFNEFLFATVGEERMGVPLSVLSAFARLDLDPWLEAARLSDLPRESAVAALSGIIARLPVGGWEISETRGIAARLIEALPRCGPVSPAGPAKADGTRKARLPAWLILVALGSAIFLGVAVGGELPWSGGTASRSLPSSHSPQ